MENFKKLIKSFLQEQTHLKPLTLRNQEAIINKFGREINYNEAFTLEDIKNFLNSEKFNSLEITSQNTYKRKLKPFFIWMGFSKKILNQLLRKKTEIIKTIKKADLLTRDEIREILKKMRRPVDKCILMMLLESKARKRELIDLKIKDVVFYDSHAMLYIRSSKTAQRNIPLVESIPYIFRYLEDHPQKDDPEAPFFITKYRGIFNKYSPNAFNRILERNAGFLDKNIYPHLLRHTGLTEMASKLTEFQLKQIAGWTMSSKQAARYVHLSNDDLENKILEIHGIKPPEKETRITHIEIIKCPRCEFENTDLDRFCSRCGSALNIQIVLDHKEEAKELDYLVKRDFQKYIDELFEKKLNEIKRL